MPFNPTAMQASVPQTASNGSPKYFDRHLTGAGGSIGLLQRSLDPSTGATDPGNADHYIQFDARLTGHSMDVKTSMTSRQAASITIPVALVPETILADMSRVVLPRPDAMIRVSDGIWLDMWPETIVYEEVSDAVSKTTKRSVWARWVILVARLGSDPTSRDVPLARAFGSSVPSHACEQAVVFLSDSPAVDATALCHDAGATDDEAKAALDQVSLAGSVARESLVWQHDAGAVVEGLVRWLDPSERVDGLARVVTRLSNYDVPMDDYVMAYHALSQVLTDAELSYVIHSNLSMMLTRVLDGLRVQAPACQRMAVPTPAPPTDPRLTPEQRAAVTTTAPLVLVSAGAGTGKSSTIRQRLAWMAACGVDMSDVLCLSFTNAAADHLTELAPQVRSMTIAKMVHLVYSASHPTHQLANARTMGNAILMRFHDDDVARELSRVARGVAQDPSATSWTRLNDFVQANLGAVIAILDSLQMVTLELEAVICYQCAATLTEPPEVSCRYLILDEVQDNSLFEFVYVIQHVTMHHKSLYIVGDGAQTLYEFRNSNPEILNALSRTGVFENHSLQVNFRSNQAILDYANTVLETVHANEAAGVVLRSDDLSPVTRADFEDRVRLSYVQLQSQKAWSDGGLQHALASDECHRFVAEALDAHRQVALVTQSRRLAAIMEGCMRSQFPRASVANICPARPYLLDALSRFCATRWEEVAFSPAPLSDVRTCVLADLPSMGIDPAHHYDEVREMLDDWYMRTLNVYTLWRQQEAAGQITHDQLLAAIQETLVAYENAHNAVAQQVVGRRNAERKATQNASMADIVVSTIHSVKGLEFDDVVIDYLDANDMDEDRKRMYYVALTRAKSHELVLAHGPLVNPACQARWDLCHDSYRI